LERTTAQTTADGSITKITKHTMSTKKIMVSWWPLRALCASCRSVCREIDEQRLL